MEEAVPRRRPKKREKEFLTDLGREFKKVGWGFKLPDMPARSGSGMSGGRFNLPKKFDFVCVSKHSSGRMTAVEGKMWTLKSEPTFSRLLKELRPATEKDPGQFQNLLSVTAHGGRAFIVAKRFIPRGSLYCIADVTTGALGKCSDLAEMASIISGLTQIKQDPS